MRISYHLSKRHSQNSNLVYGASARLADLRYRILADIIMFLIEISGYREMYTLDSKLNDCFERI